MKKKMIFILFIVIIFSLIYTSSVFALTSDQKSRIETTEIYTEQDDKEFANALTLEELKDAIELLNNDIKTLDTAIEDGHKNGGSSYNDTEAQSKRSIYKTRLERFEDVKNERESSELNVLDNMESWSTDVIELYMIRYSYNDTIYQQLHQQLIKKLKEEYQYLSQSEIETKIAEIEESDDYKGNNGSVKKLIAQTKHTELLNVKKTELDTGNWNDWKPTLLSDDSKFLEKAGIILGTINVIGVAVSVITIAILGVKYIIAPVEEKAEYKQTSIGWIIGAVLTFSATTIPNIIYHIMK